MFTVRAFHRWAKRAEISDLALFRAIEELDAGLIDARLAATFLRKGSPLPREESGAVPERLSLT
ncbi:MAG: type II toxin-antitoxin system RelE/ParE family toxin [Deltaproteobacteria bacterium]|nr:type II toxin-antitoxin system RelE/ParE family toxin [Deltaproteobacteria bacterium]